MIRLLLAASVGIFAGSLLLSVTDLDTPGTLWVLPVAATVMTISLTLVSIARGFGGAGVAGASDVEAAERENRICLARVLDTRATGSTINDQPLCDIRLLVAPSTRAAYETSTRALVNLGRLPSLQRGAVVVVAQLDAARPEVALLDPPPGDWQQRADGDRSVRAMASAPEWQAPPRRGRDARGFWRIPGVVLVVVAILGFGGRLYPERDAVLAVASGTPLEEAREDAQRARDEAASIFPADRTRQVVDDLVAVAGGTQFTDITLGQLFASAEGLTTPGATTTDSFSWRDGEAAREGAALIQPDAEELAAELFDVAEVDWSAVERLTGQAGELTGIEEPDGVVVTVHRASVLDGPAPLEILVSVDGEYHDGLITADPTGQVVDMAGGAPGSPAATWEAGQAATS